MGYKDAERLAQHGATVVVSGRSQERGQHAVRQLGARSDRVHFVAGDCRRYSDVMAMVAEAVSFGGGLDILIAPGRRVDRARYRSLK